MKSASIFRAVLLAGVLSALSLLSFQAPAAYGASRNSSHAAPDGTVRQTAGVWKGSPLGPDGSFEDPNREYYLRLTDVFNAMGIQKGDTVADIGAGGGWLTVRLANRVGESGTVYAEDIFTKYTSFIDARARKAGLKNVRTILGTVTDPKLPQNALDEALILNAYHEFEQPLAMLRKIYSALKPGGRLGIIENDTDELRREAREAYAKTGTVKRRVTESRDNDPLTDDHRLALDVVEHETAKIGLRKVSVLELRSYYYLLVVERPKSASNTSDRK